MKVLLLTRSGARGPQAKKTVTADWLRVGRNASCEVHLADPRVPLEQGMIVNRDGLVYLEGEGGSQSVTRKGVRSIRLQPGKPLELGPYRIEAQPAPAGFDAALSVELVHPLEAGIASDLAERASRRTLASMGLSKRRVAWLFGVAILLAFLVVPAARVLDLPWKEASQASPLGDRVWDPGPVILAHQPIGTKCDACHEVAFEHVKDRACLECHRTIGRHVNPGVQPAALFEGDRCTGCHRDHKGAKTTHRDDDTFCVECHREIRSRAQGTAAGNVTDFAKAHPAFRLSIPTEEGVRRVRMDAQRPPVEKSNLVFPHAIHLDPRGVRSPLQGRMRLECKSCHQPDASKRSFQPVSMARHCQECHTLQFEPAVTTREVPHGKPADAITVVEEFYANIALRGVRDSFQKAFGVPGEGLLRRPGGHGAAERGQALALATRKARQVSAELFEVRVCKTCHEVSREGEEGWKVAPIRANNAWMPQARFDHQSHLSAKCADCHDVSKSKKASDVAMPRIEACRECHGGSRPVEGKLTSNCLMCHAFHDEKHLWDPQFRPRNPNPTRVAGSSADGR